MEVKEKLIQEIGETQEYISNCVPGSDEETLALEKLEKLCKILNEFNKNEAQAILDEARIDIEDKWKKEEINNAKKNQKIDLILKASELGLAATFFVVEVIFTKNENRLTRIFEETGTIRDKTWCGTAIKHFNKKKS